VVAKSTFAFYNSYQSEGPRIKCESVRESAIAFY